MCQVRTRHLSGQDEVVNSESEEDEAVVNDEGK